MKRNPSIIYLEQVQEAFCKKSGINVKKLRNEMQKPNDQSTQNELQTLKKFLKKDQMKSIKKAIASYKIKTVNVPTKYETTASYSILMGLSKKIDDGLKILQFEKEGKFVKIDELDLNIKKPIFGTIYSRRINAYSLKVPTTNDYLVLFDAELMMYCLLLSKIVAFSIPTKKIVRGKKIESSLKLNNAIKKKLKRLKKFEFVLLNF